MKLVHNPRLQSSKQMLVWQPENAVYLSTSHLTQKSHPALRSACIALQIAPAN